MASKESKIEYGVSTVTFIDQHISILRGIRRFLLPGIIKRPNLGEFSEAVDACEELEIGIEVAFRKWGEDEIEKVLTEKEIPVLNIHGSGWFNTIHAISQGFEEDNKTWIIADPLLSWVAFGFLKGEFEKSYDMAKGVGSPSLTLHPGGAELLYKKGLLEEKIKEGVMILVEPDWRRANPLARTWVCDWQEISRLLGDIHQNTGLEMGVTFDTSHDASSQNKLDLGSAFEHYNNNSPAGVRVIHLAGAKPGPKGRIFGGLPLDPRVVPESVIRHYQEFHQMLRGIQWDGSIIVELSSQVGKTREKRIKSVETTLNALETMPRIRSLSLPGEPTHQPL